MAAVCVCDICLRAGLLAPTTLPRANAVCALISAMLTLPAHYHRRGPAAPSPSTPRGSTRTHPAGAPQKLTAVRPSGLRAWAAAAPVVTAAAGLAADRRSRVSVPSTPAAAPDGSGAAVRTRAAVAARAARQPRSARTEQPASSEPPSAGGAEVRVITAAAGQARQAGDARKARQAGRDGAASRRACE